MTKIHFFLVIYLALWLPIQAQIGYQVSLLNNATGEARANERVTVKVKITDSEGNIVCEETKNETSNDFGVVSMSVGDSETFANADWSKLPFFIEASVDGRLLGKSQLLSVPVAEYAKRTGELTIDLLCSKTWAVDFYDGERLYGYAKYQFDNNGIYHSEGKYSIDGNIIFSIGSYFIDGNDLVLCESNSKVERGYLYKYNPITNKLYHADGDEVLK